jgi:7,8-dihydroneopterin aldolase/epimerase/oxygenase
MSFINPLIPGLPRNWIASEILDVRVLRKCGLHEWERHPERPNLMSVSVRMYAHYTGEASVHIDYDPVRDHLAGWPAMDHTDTLEEIAEELLKVAFASPIVLACWVKLSKPLIFAEAQSAGIEVFRWRDNPLPGQP